MENDINEIIEAERQRNEIIKRIQEKERLINLIQSKHIKGGLKEIKEFQDKYKFQKDEKPQEKPEIQPQPENQENLTQSYLFRQTNINNINNINTDSNISQLKETKEKEFATIKFNSFQQGVNYISMVKRLQRAFRKLFLYKNKRRIRNYYLNKLIKEFYKPISYERGAELRKILIERLKQWKVPSADQEYIANKYLEEYKNFCFSFPEKERIREDNFFIYYQTLDLLNYMENLKPETALNDCEQFKKFMLDKNKEFSTKLIIDEMEQQYKYKNDIYQYTIIDDFEEKNLLDEIDNRYNFEPRSVILNKK